MLALLDTLVPIFVGRCVSCHQPSGEGTEKSGLDLTSYAGVMKGTKFGKSWMVYLPSIARYQENKAPGGRPPSRAPQSEDASRTGEVD